MYTASVLMERQNVLVVDTRLTIAKAAAERQAAHQKNAHIPSTRWTTVGTDGAHDSKHVVRHTIRRYALPRAAATSCTTPFDTLAILDGH